MTVGFTYGGVHSDTFGVYLRSKPMGLVPQPRSTEFTIPGRPGLFVPNTEAGVRTIKLQIDYTNKEDGQAATSASINANLEALAALLDPEKGDRELKFDDRPGRRLMARLEGESEVARQVLHGQGEITMRAAAPPYWLGDPRTVVWSTLGSGDSMYLTSAGTKETPLKITVQARGVAAEPAAASPGLGTASEPFGPLTDWNLTVAVKPVVFVGSLTLTDERVIDTGALTVTLNGQNALHRWTGGFPKLPAGGATLIQTDRFESGAVMTFDLSDRFT